MSRNDYSNLKAFQNKKAKLYKAKEYPDTFSLINSTLKQTQHTLSKKPIGIKRIASTQLMNPIIPTHSMSPKKHNNLQHYSSAISVFKYYNYTKNLKKYNKATLTKYNNTFKSSNSSLIASMTNKNSINHSTSTLTPGISNNIHSNKMNTNNFIINTLNVSAKNLIGNTVDYYEPIDYEVKMKKLQKENEELLIKHKDQIETIKECEGKNKKLRERVIYVSEANAKIRKKYNEAKESENQLLAILYVLDQCGVCVDEIIDQYNKENQSIRDTTKRSVDSNMYTPITLEHSVQPKPMKNIPKLNLKNIHNFNNCNGNNGNKGNEKEEEQNNTELLLGDDDEYEYEYEENEDVIKS